MNIITQPDPKFGINDFGINKLKLRIKAERFDPLKSPTSKILSVN
jgi:hypothetical protein